MGPLHVVRAHTGEIPTWTIRDSGVEREIGRLSAAIEEASSRLERQQELVRQSSGEREAGIFAVHRMILEDPNAKQKVEDTIRDQRINAETAVDSLIRDLSATMSRLEGDTVRDYASDVADPWNRVMDVLLQREQRDFVATGERVVLAAAELTPQVATWLPRERILAIVAETGGRFSHGAVLARSFGFPCVVGCPNLLARLEQGMQILVDGDGGVVELDPDEAAIAQFEVRQQRRAERLTRLKSTASREACTPDGRRLEVCANLESLLDLKTFDLDICDGVGLLRTEFLYMERPHFPSEEEQFRMYRRVVEEMKPKRVVIRTLDIGGDKCLPYFRTPAENNPQLGWRGLRITLEWQDLLRVQLRAALRASTAGSLGILLPMVTSIEEIRAVHEIFRDVRSQLVEQGYEVAEDVPVGMMIEVPSTIFTLEEMVQEVDFVSVGTNDLTQYLLAVDRDNTRVARLYEPEHPAVIRALAQIARICNEANTPCSVCGEFAGDEANALLLLGMGYTSVSVSPNFLTEVRAAIQHYLGSEADALAKRVVLCITVEEVQRELSAVRDGLHARMLRVGIPESTGDETALPSLDGGKTA
ncbi:MAG: phosphotransferase system enzyme I (PtsI) [Planctomycetota bacterium]|jgi:phosphotransferase system enzyme I (PtsI)